MNRNERSILAAGKLVGALLSTRLTSFMRRGRFEKMFHESAAGFADISFEGNLLEVNESLAEITGYSVSELRQMQVTLLLHPDDLAASRENLRKIAAGEIRSYIAERRIIRKDGSARWISIAAVAHRNACGKPVSCFVVVSDIHEKKLLEEALRRSEERYRITETATNDAIWEYTSPPGIIHWNKGVATLFGYSYENVPTDFDYWIDQIHPDDVARVRSGLSEAIAADHYWEAEYRMKKFDGSYLDVRSRAFIEPAKEGRPLHITGAMTDISKLKQYQAELEEVNRNLKNSQEDALRAAAVKADFLSNMSHEIRTPLNAIIGTTELLAETDLSPEQRKNVSLLA
ncbi:MAG TPA: PAS domain S-box protein, partial [Bdellovibrionales bacterium]|nr:PAS domain S-box protein [Bdellovibrionales bacterium]